MVAQSTNMPWAQGMNYGIGVNLLNGNVAGRAVDAGKITGPTDAPGQTVSYNLIKINSFEELYDSIGISVAVAGQYGLFYASGKFKYASESKFNSQATFLLAHCVVANPFTQAENAQLVPDAYDLIKQGKTGVFQGRYGDGFVRGMKTGGEFFSIISVTSSSQELQESISSDLQAKYGGPFLSAKVDASLDTSTKSKIGKSELSISTFQSGGTGDEASLTNDIEGVMARLAAFPAQAQRNPVAYEVQVASYSNLALPEGPNLIDIQAQSFALTDYARIQLKLLAIRNDIEFLQRHPEFFLDPPEAVIVSQWQQFIVDQLNQIVRQASVCTSNPVGGCGLFALKLPDGFAMPQRKPNLCPNIGGVYTRSDGGRVIQFKQDGFSITCIDVDPAFEHHGTGDWNGTSFDYTVVRRNIASGCVTQMFGEILVSEGRLTANILGSDGMCDLAKTFTETSEWVKN